MIEVACRGERIYRFAPATTALLSIDFQREFFTEGSGECLDEMRAMLPRAAALLALMRDLGCRIIHTRESYRPDLADVSAYRRSLDYVGRPGPLGRFCILGEPGHEFVDGLQPRDDEVVIDKASFGAFYRSGLERVLAHGGIDHLVLSGVTTQCCVHSTLREAVDRGFWCLTVADCCAASEPGLHDAALDLIAGEGHLFGWVSDYGQLADAVAGSRVSPGPG